MPIAPAACGLMMGLVAAGCSGAPLDAFSPADGLVAGLTVEAADTREAASGGSAANRDTGAAAGDAAANSSSGGGDQATGGVGESLLPVGPAIDSDMPGQAGGMSDAVDAFRADAEHFLLHAGRLRRYLVHIPVGWDERAPLPVVVALHGGLGRAEVQRRASRLNEVADAHGFLAVYPDGTGWQVEVAGVQVPLLVWNAGGCCEPAVSAGVDDVGFIEALLDDLAQRYAVDERRIYATGMSNGAMMAYRLAVELPHRIAAIAAVAGSMMVDGPVPPRAVPVLHFHGLADENAPFEGGAGRNFANNPILHRPVPATIAWWVDVNACRPEPLVTSGPDYERYEFVPAQAGGGAPVVLYVLPGGGHTWPGGVDVTAHLETGPLIESVNASRLMWEFFVRFTLPGEAPAAAP